MFTPNPAKAQEPVFLTPDNIFTLHLKANSEIMDPNANPNRIDLNKNRVKRQGYFPVPAPSLFSSLAINGFPVSS